MSHRERIGGRCEASRVSWESREVFELTDRGGWRPECVGETGMARRRFSDRCELCLTVRRCFVSALMRGFGGLCCEALPDIASALGPNPPFVWCVALSAELPQSPRQRQHGGRALRVQENRQRYESRLALVVVAVVVLHQRRRQVRCVDVLIAIVILHHLVKRYVEVPAVVSPGVDRYVP